MLASSAKEERSVNRDIKIAADAQIVT